MSLGQHVSQQVAFLSTVSEHVRITAWILAALRGKIQPLCDSPIKEETEKGDFFSVATLKEAQKKSSDFQPIFVADTKFRFKLKST